MTMQGANDKAGNDTAARSKRELPPAAQRALAEAEERRRRGQLMGSALPKEVNGRDGPEPVRYGDWEVKGIVSDF
jgi:hypothetical protein